MHQVQQTIKKFIPCRQRTHKSFLSWLPARHTNASELQQDCSFLFRNKRSTKQHNPSDTQEYFKIPGLGSDKHTCDALHRHRHCSSSSGTFISGRISKVGHYLLAPIVAVRGEKK